jgi:hypothetical protein
MDGVEAVQDGEELLPGTTHRDQGRDEDQTKCQLTQVTVLLDKHKGPRSRNASNRTPSALAGLIFALAALLLVLAGSTTLDALSWLPGLPGLPAMHVVEMEVSVLERLE